MIFETIPGSDALLISAPKIPSNIPLEPTLGPDELQKLAQGARYNTDDYPWIEFESSQMDQPLNRNNKSSDN